MAYLYEEPSFEEYVAARKVVFYVYEQLREEKYNGHLSVASDEMVARIVLKSCERYRPDVRPDASKPDPHE